MDSKVSAVLDSFHERIAREREERRGGLGRPQPGEWDRRLLAIGSETGRLVNILARSLAAPTILELGTSYGYSGIWLADAARASGGHMITMELHDYKSAAAREMAEAAGLADHVTFKVGDAVAMIGDLNAGLDFVLVDLVNQLYLPCLEAFAPKLNPGAIVVADNIGREDTRAYVERVRSLPGMVSFPLPVGNGLEISRWRST